MNNPIYVSIELNGVTHLVGRLWFRAQKNRESASFEYDRSWIKNSERFALEPALQLTAGAHHTPLHQKIFGAIGDSCPDRWGRVLMRRMHRLKDNQSKQKTLTELDYLLGVNDLLRQGALRFSENIDGPFLSESKHSIPLLIELPKLLSASERFLGENETLQDLKLLLAPGSSLGGARPKSAVINKDGGLAIAKFSRVDDEYNVVLWEAVALSIAKLAGICTPSWNVEKILDKSVLIINRFDRHHQRRIPFLSAMSMLGANDNELHSYIELVYALEHHGANPNQDMAELWRRIVFNILISNTDDHLRNHGFLYTPKHGWILSPVYDINPVPVEVKPRVLTTLIDFDDSTASLDLALSVIDEFRLSLSDAHSIVRQVAAAVSQWQNIAQSYGISKKEITMMATAFEHKDLKQAIKI